MNSGAACVDEVQRLLCWINSNPNEWDELSSRICIELKVDDIGIISCLANQSLYGIAAFILLATSADYVIGLAKRRWNMQLLAQEVQKRGVHMVYEAFMTMLQEAETQYKSDKLSKNNNS